MPDFVPFRRDPLRLPRVTATTYARAAAPPYDVIDDEQRGGARGRRPPQRGAAHPAARRATPTATATTCAAATLRGVARGGHARARPGAALLRVPHGLPRRRTAGRGTRTGVIGALALPEPGDGDGAPPRAHAAEGEERPARAAAGDARQPRPDLGPLAHRGAHRSCSTPRDAAAPRASTTTASSTRCSRSTTRRASRRSAPRSRRSPLVLADGHHRFETALHVPRRTPRAGSTTTRRRRRSWRFVVELADDELCIEPIHRLLAPAAPASDARASLLADAFDVDRRGREHARGRRARSAARWPTDGRARARRRRRPRAARRRPEVARPRSPASPAVRGTDAALVEAVVVPLLAGASIDVPPRRRRRRRARRQGCRGRRGAAATGHGRADTAPPRSPVCACRRRRRSSRPSRAPAWCSAASTTLSASAPRTRRLSRPSRSRRTRAARARSPGPERSTAAASCAAPRPRTSAAAMSRNTPTGVGMFGAVGEPRQRERQRRVGPVLVVDEQPVLADVGDLAHVRLAELVDARRPCWPSAPKRIGSPCSSGMSMSARTSRLRMPSNAPSLKTLQFWYTSTNAAPWCSWARRNDLHHVLAVHVVGAGHEASPRRRWRPRSG